MPAQCRFVKHVVVDQRGRVDQFGRHGQGQMLGPNCPTGLGRQQHQGRPKPFPPQTKPVLGQPVDKGVVAGKLLLKQPLDGFEFLCGRRIQSAETAGNRRSMLAH